MKGLPALERHHDLLSMLVQLHLQCQRRPVMSEANLLQVETGKENGKSHSWVDGSEVEADRWVNTADAAALDAWGREPSPEPASMGTAELQALGGYAHHIREAPVLSCALCIQAEQLPMTWAPASAMSRRCKVHIRSRTMTANATVQTVRS